MSGRAKCTWQYLVADGSMGPTIKLKAASYVKFLFFWTEWLNTDGLTTDGRLPQTSGANYHIGSYPANDGVFLNPVKTITDSANKWKQSQIEFSHDETDPSSRVPGSIGDAIYFTRAEGPFKST